MHLARDMNNCDTNLHEPCNGYTEFDMFYYLAITIFEICLIIKVSEDYCPCRAPERFYCRYKKSNFLYLVYPNTSESCFPHLEFAFCISDTYFNTA